MSPRASERGKICWKDEKRVIVPAFVSCPRQPSFEALARYRSGTPHAIRTMPIQEADLNSLYGCILDAGIRLMSADMASRATSGCMATRPQKRLASRIRSLAADGRLVLRWTESGGPPVKRPTRQGFGTHAMERMIRSQLNGEMRFDWHTEGLCKIILRT
jgi:hypothetical protein